MLMLRRGLLLQRWQGSKRDRVLEKGQLAKEEVGQTGLLAREGGALVQQPNSSREVTVRGVMVAQCASTER